jgi:hypothetical protein
MNGRAVQQTVFGLNQAQIVEKNAGNRAIHDESLSKEKAVGFARPSVTRATRHDQAR